MNLGSSQSTNVPKETLLDGRYSRTWLV